MSKRFYSKAVLASALALSLAMSGVALAAETDTDTTESSQSAAAEDADKAAEKAAKAAEEAEKKFYVVVSADRSMLGLQPGDTFLIHSDVKVPSGKKPTVIWSSSDPTIVSVSQDGRIKAEKLGDAVVTAGVGSIKASVRVSVGLNRLSYDTNITSSSKSGYTSQNEIDAAVKVADVMPIGVFEGTWDTVSSHLGNDAVVRGLTSTQTQDGKKVVVKKAETLTGEFSADFKSIVIEEGKVSFVGLSGSADSGAEGEAAATATDNSTPVEYAPVETIKADKLMTVNIYESTDEEAPFRYIALSNVQVPSNDEKEASLFYISYSDDLSSLKSSETWSTMMINAETKDAVLVAMFKADYEKPAKASSAPTAADAAADAGAEEVAESGAEEVADAE